MTPRGFTGVTVWSCIDCKSVKKEFTECAHTESYPVKMIMSNGNHQIKMFCKTCQSIHGKALKQNGFDLSKLKASTFESYERYNHERAVIIKEKVDEYIESLNFPEYNQIYIDYLKSEEWGSIRNIIMQRDNFTCQICSGKATDVHHLNYEHLKNEFHFELVGLCRDCHMKYYKSRYNEPVR
jgi:hypothetical protein